MVLVVALIYTSLMTNVLSIYSHGYWPWFAHLLWRNVHLNPFPNSMDCNFFPTELWTLYIKDTDYFKRSQTSLLTARLLGFDYSAIDLVRENGGE